LLRLNTAAMNQTGTAQIMNLLRNEVMKMYAWQKPFRQIVSVIRNLEIKQIKFSSYMRAAYLAIIVFIERLTVYFTLITFVLMGNNLTADVTYEISTYFNILQLVVALYFPQGLILLGDFLLMNEVNTRRFSENTPQLQFKSQKPKEESNAENQIDRYISRNGSIVLSEHQRLPDLPVYVKLQRVQVANVCALTKDFRQFSQGDMIMVGDRGVFLSGGQRARFNLVRAVYRQADIYLLDGPLSAVDTRVARHLYGKCITEHSDIDDSDYVENIPEAEMIESNRPSIPSPFSLIVSLTKFQGFGRNSGNNFTLFVLLMIFIISQVVTTGNDYWLSYWTTLENVRRIENTSVQQFANMYNDSFLGSIFTLNSDGLLNTMDAICVYTFCIIACITTTLFHSFLYMVDIDSCTVVVLFFFATKSYMKIGQDLKCLEGVMKSPIFSNVNATLNDLPTIRSSGIEIEKLMQKRFDELQGRHSGTWYLFLT
ncbi:MRP4 protein, partial [Acromyrmex heyeri]